MRKLYNDIIYFVQNHVKPVTPSNSYPSSLLLCSPTSTANPFASNGSLVQKPLNQLLGYYPPTNAKQIPQVQVLNSPSTTSQSTLTILEDSNTNGFKTKLFGVPLQSKKRLHPEYSSSTGNMEPSKARLVLENDDLGLNLMPPSAC